MIKFYHVKNKTVAVLCDTEMDCLNKIRKISGNSELYILNDKYLMPKSFRAVATCHAPDVFDAKVGEDEAKKKLMKKYYACFDKKMELFRDEVAALATRSGLKVGCRCDEATRVAE